MGDKNQFVCSLSGKPCMRFVRDFVAVVALCAPHTRQTKVVLIGIFFVFFVSFWWKTRKFMDLRMR